MRHHHLLNKKSESLSIGDVSTVVLISFSIGCQFLQSCPHFRFCSVVVDGAWFVGDSRWYRVSFPITGPSYLSNTLCSVGITELAQCVYVKPGIGRVGGWGSLS